MQASQSIEATEYGVQVDADTFPLLLYVIRTHMRSVCKGPTYAYTYPHACVVAPKPRQVGSALLTLLWWKLCPANLFVFTGKGADRGREAFEADLQGRSTAPTPVYGIRSAPPSSMGFAGPVGLALSAEYNAR